MNGQQPGRIQADPRVTAYQTHARIYCERMGMNPDDMVQLPHPTLAGVNVQTPVWYTVAERMFDLSALMISIREGHAAMEASAVAANDQKAPA